MINLDQEIANLEQQEAIFQKNFEEAPDDLSRLAFENELNNVRQKLKDKRSELEEYHAYQEQKATEVVEDITSGIETFIVGDTTFTLDQLVIDDDCAKILRSGLRSISKAQAQKFLDEINNQKTVYETQLKLRDAQVQHLTADVDSLQNQNAQLHLDNEDLSEKRDAAARALEEAQTEIARLNSHVDDLRKEIANGSTPNNIIDITSDADLEAAAQRLKAKKEQAAEEKRAAAEAAKIPVYDVKEEFRSQVGTIKTFKLAENGEDGEIIWTNFNLLYRVMSDDEVKRFRAELEAARKAELESTPEAEITPEPVEDTFRPEPLPAPDLQDVDTGHGLDENVTEREDGQNGEGGASTVEARLTALELAVFGQAKAAA